MHAWMHVPFFQFSNTLCWFLCFNASSCFAVFIMLYYHMYMCSGKLCLFLVDVVYEPVVEADVMFSIFHT